MSESIITRFRLLLVDDVIANIKVLGEALSEDYELQFARSGEEAIELARGKPSPDLILLDVRMPDMDGFETCQKLKQDPATTHIPAIFVTAMDDHINEAKGLEVGAVDYIMKPASPLVVKIRVKLHLELAQQRRLLELLLKRLAEDLNPAERAILQRLRAMTHGVAG